MKNWRRAGVWVPIAPEKAYLTLLAWHCIIGATARKLVLVQQKLKPTTISGDGLRKLIRLFCSGGD